MVIQRVGLFANNCVQMVHQLITTPIGDADENDVTAWYEHERLG